MVARKHSGENLSRIQRLTDQERAFIEAEAPEKAKKQENKQTSQPVSRQVIKDQFTVRLDRELLQTLQRVSAERKAARSEPYKQMDIVAQALEEWLERNSS